MADRCVYTLLDKNGNSISLAGRAALKTYLFEGGLEQLFPKRAVPALISGKSSGKILVDGKERWTTNSEGIPLANTEEGIRNFWKWFGDSKIVDSEGKPVRLFHITPKSYITKFELGGEKTLSTPMSGSVAASQAGVRGYLSGPGIWTTDDPNRGLRAAHNLRDKSGLAEPNTMPLYGAIKNPLVISSIQQADELADKYKVHPMNLPKPRWERHWETGKQVRIETTKLDFPYRFDHKQREEIIADGYDGIILQLPNEPREIIALFNNQLKSATANTGAFSAENPDIRYSRPAITASEVLQEVKRDDAIFKHPISFKRDIADVMSEVAPKFKYLPEQNDIYGDGLENQVRVFETSDGAHLLIKESDGRVWIDVSGSTHGEGMGALYAAVGNYAYNTGKVFIDDPAGVSRDAVIRRPEHMLSLALRFGRTDFLGVSENFENVSRKEGLLPLHWGQDYEENLNNLIARNTDSLYKAMPYLRSLKYDFNTNEFKDELGGNLPSDWAAKLARSEAARTINAGESTIRRGVFLKSLASSSSAEKSRILENLGANGHVAERGQIKGIFSRPDRETDERFQPITPEEAKQHLVDNFGVGFENLYKQGVVEAIQTVDDLPYLARKGARGDEEGVYFNGKIYFILGNIPSVKRLIQVAIHEIGEHFGLRRMLGNQAYHSLQQQITNRAKIAGSKAEAVWAEVKANYGHLEEGSDQFVAEVIAKLGETNFKAPWYRRLISQIKAFLMRMGLARGLVAGTITDADMHDLLVASLRSAAAGKVKDKAEYFGGQEVMASRAAEELPEKIAIGSAERWTVNSDGKPIANTEEGIRNFWKWFGDSKIVDHSGKPLISYHGTSADFSEFNNGPIYLTPRWDYGYIKRSPTVMPTYAAIENPYRPEDQSEIEQIRSNPDRMAELQKEGFDGMLWSKPADIMRGASGWGDDLPQIVAFSPSQIKSAIGNTGEFSAENPDIRYSRPAILDRVLKDEQGEPTLISQAVRKLGEKWDAIAKQRFAAMSVRQMTEYAKHIMPELKRYENLLQKREAEVSSWLRVADRLVSETWKKLPKPELRKLAKVMHDSTLADIDASTDWTGSREGYLPNGGQKAFFAYTQETLTQSRRVSLAKEAAKHGAIQFVDGDMADPETYLNKRGFAFRNTEDAANFVNYIRQQVESQRKERASKGWADKNTERAAAHQTAQAEFAALTDKAKQVYSEANKMHDDIFDARLSTLEDRISDAVINGQKRKMLLAQVRTQFESGSLNWYYAPLSRFGDEWFYGTKDGKKWFRTFESPDAKKQAMGEFEQMGGTIIGAGTVLKNLDKLEGVGASDSFILDIQKRIDGVEGLDPEVGNKLKDQIYQMYLSTLPDVSVRHNSMHRAGTLGFDEDAMRSFSNAMHHGATQLANMMYGRDMRAVLEQHIKAKKMAERTDTKKYTQAEIDAAELLKENWDSLTEPNALEEMLRNRDELEEPIEAETLNAAIQLRNRLHGMEARDAVQALDNVIEENSELLRISGLIQPADTKRATEVLDELLLSYDHMVNYNSSAMDRVASAINQANFVGMLGFGISSGAVNLLQTPGVAMPVAAGKFGIAPVIKEFGRAFNEFMSALAHKNLDSDGNVSLSAIMQNQWRVATSSADKLRLEEEMGVLDDFKNAGDISRTRTFDIMGIGQEGATYGGRFHVFALKAGWMFHHGERLNREVTLMATYRLARQSGMEVKEAVDYARFVNNRAHLDYSSENAARIFRGPLAKIALQFKKYQQGMLFLWTKTAIDGWKTLSREKFPPTAEGQRLFEQAMLEQKESRRTFTALLAMQASLAGALGLPMMGMLGVCYEMIVNAFGDDDEPADFQKDLRLGLANIFGDTAAESMAKGIVNTFTPINLASRLDQADVFFKEPLKELEGRDAATQYIAEVFGPTGGTVQKTWQGLSLLSDGQIMRGIEQLSPKFVGDIAKAARFTTEGAKTLDNMPLKDMSAFEEFAQALGFGSSALERRYAERGYAKGEEAAIKETRTKIMREAAWAKIKGETVDMSAIRAWNLKHPEKKILAENISASVKGIKESTEKRKDRGYVVDPKLEYLYEENEVMD